jgi:hypothetical protein
MIDEVNNSWVESLMSKSKRPKPSSPTYSVPSPVVASTSLTNSVTLQRVVPSQGVGKAYTEKFPTASIVSVNGAKTAIPLPAPPPLKSMSASIVSPATLRDDDYNDVDEDSDDDDEDVESSLLFEPQVILNTSSQDDGYTSSTAAGEVEMSSVEVDNADEEVFVEEFCDVCSMELINHADEQPCDPDDAYVKAYKSCHVCDAFEPTREHVSRHFLSELLEVVDCFPNPLACTQCDYQVAMLQNFFSLTNVE